MWLFTTIGFFSIVQKPKTSHLTVRARAKGDLDNLRSRYLSELSPVIAKAGTDYPWRATVPHEAFAAAVGKMVADVTYENFKNQVTKTQGRRRANAYHDVWSALLELQDGDPLPPKARPPSPGTL